MNYNDDPVLKYGGPRGSTFPLAHPMLEEKTGRRITWIFTAVLMVPILLVALYPVYKEFRKDQQQKAQRAREKSARERRDAALCGVYPVPFFTYTGKTSLRFINNENMGDLFPIPASQYFRVRDLPRERSHSGQRRYQCIGSTPVLLSLDNPSKSREQSRIRDGLSMAYPGLISIDTHLKQVCKDYVSAPLNSRAAPLVLNIINNDFSALDLSCLSKLKSSAIYLRIAGKINDSLLKRLARNTKLRGLFVPCYGNGGAVITDEGVQSLTALTRLKILDLSASRITQKGLSILSTLPELEELRLDDVPLSAAGVIILAGFPALKRLSLRGTGLASADFKGLAEMKGLEGLILRCSSSRGCPLDAGAFSHLIALPRLSEIQVGHYVAVDDDALSYISKIRGLRRLAIHDATKITVTGLKKLLALPSLESLSLTHSNLDDEIFSVLKQMPRLRALRIGGLRVTEKYWDDFASMKNMEILKIQSASFSDLHMEQVAKLKKLRVFFANGNLITKQGMDLLRQDLPRVNAKRSWDFD
ncbi:hypothetical protein KKF84_08635 [Myxococcota bacterium]|nr:hypothetical protein [Myxococcota bacterium]MBU1535374.1 hypothetical protein [Myxococcota bacterium]